MKHKETILAFVVIASFALGVFAFIWGAYAHIWHLFGFPSCWVAAVAFVIANFAFTMLFGKEHTFSYASLMIKQGATLGVIFLLLDTAFPFCLMMAQALLLPTLGMVCLGLFIKLAFWITSTFIDPYQSSHLVQ